MLNRLKTHRPKRPFALRLLILSYSEASPLHGVFYPSSYPKLLLLALRARARRNAPPRFAFAACGCSGPRGFAPRQRGFRLASFFLLSYLRLTTVLLGVRLRLAAVGHVTLRISSFAPRQCSCHAAMALRSAWRRFTSLMMSTLRRLVSSARHSSLHRFPASMWN